MHAIKLNECLPILLFESTGDDVCGFMMRSLELRFNENKTVF